MNLQNMNISQKAFLSGILVGIGNIAAMMHNLEVVGAIMFSLSLLVILHLRIPLFVGRINKAYRNTTYPEQISILGFNFLGVAVTAIGFILMDKGAYLDVYRTVCMEKYSRSWLALFISGFMCSVLIHIALAAKSDLITILCSCVFFLCNFEHCVSASGFMLGAFMYTDGIALFKWVAILAGNIVGAHVTAYLLYGEQMEPKEFLEKNAQKEVKNKS